MRESLFYIDDVTYHWVKSPLKLVASKNMALMLIGYPLYVPLARITVAHNDTITILDEKGVPASKITIIIFAELH